MSCFGYRNRDYGGYHARTNNLDQSINHSHTSEVDPIGCSEINRNANRVENTGNCCKNGADANNEAATSMSEQANPASSAAQNGSATIYGAQKSFSVNFDNAAVPATSSAFQRSGSGQYENPARYQLRLENSRQASMAYPGNEALMNNLGQAFNGVSSGERGQPGHMRNPDIYAIRAESDGFEAYTPSRVDGARINGAFYGGGVYSRQSGNAAGYYHYGKNANIVGSGYEGLMTYPGKEINAATAGEEREMQEVLNAVGYSVSGRGSFMAPADNGSSYSSSWIRRSRWRPCHQLCCPFKFSRSRWTHWRNCSRTCD